MCFAFLTNANQVKLSVVIFFQVNRWI